MPTYAYYCNDCKKEFSVVLTVAEHEHGAPPACPHCGSKNTTPEISMATVITSKKS